MTETLRQHDLQQPWTGVADNEGCTGGIPAKAIRVSLSRISQLTDPR